jgi:nucleoside diphosphate kinase
MAFLRRIDFILYLVIVYTLLYILLNIICIYNNEHFIEKSYSSNMATNRQQFEYIYKIQTQEQWEEELKKPTIEVFDVYSGWAGPCNAITSTFKRIKLELNDDVTFCQVKADEIEDLKDYRDNSCPFFLFYNHGVFVDLVQGVNASLIEKKIKQQIENEKNNVPRVLFVPEKKEKPKTPLKLKKEKKIEKEYVIAILKPEVLRNDIIEKIIEMFMKNSFAIEEKKDVELTPEQVSVIYSDMPDDDPLKAKHIEYMSSNPCLAFLLAREDPFNLLSELSGPENPAVAKEESPESIRSLYGADEIKNAIYCSKNSASVLRDTEILFPDRFNEIKQQQEKLKVISSRIQYTLILIKPDTYKEGKKRRNI